VLLGLGAGGHRRLPYAAEQQMLGLEVDGDLVRAERVAEACQVLRRLWSGDGSDFAGQHYRLARPSGYLRPEPAPPIIVGGFGPRMAAIAGRHGDGFNTQARHPRLPGLLQTAREARAESSRSGFVATVFAGLDRQWLQADSAARLSLEKNSVDRLILLVSPPFEAREIRAAGKLLPPRD
jgi:alkanesulfonate monooxygenase SsuD/methylene tetrahydromethanopterin reductase-like flavin-dependent oxidoreductase (luciferase family)